MTDLSPTAQAVLNEAMEFSGPAFELLVRKMLAAALKAAADQVVPEPTDFDKAALSIAAIRSRCKVRDEILAIAAELEGNND
jgi:hypothetical protein